MSEWWTYALEDFLLFSPRVYWRMFELHNEAVWPLHVVALLLGAAILVWVVRPRPWSDRAIAVILGVAWIWIGWAFLWKRYSGINWAVAYVVDNGLIVCRGSRWRVALRLQADPRHGPDLLALSCTV